MGDPDREKAGRVLDEVSDEVIRTRLWLENDRPAYWENQMRRLKFFHEFSSGEIWEVLRAGTFQAHARGDEIVKAGGVDDRFYVLVTGSCTVEREAD